MHDSGTGFSANSTSVLLTARSAFYSLPSAHNLRISAPRPRTHISGLTGQQSVSTHLGVCLCVWAATHTVRPYGPAFAVDDGEQVK